MRLFKNAAHGSWRGVLTVALFGTSSVKAMDLDLEDGGKSYCGFS